MQWTKLQEKEFPASNGDEGTGEISEIVVVTWAQAMVRRVGFDFGTKQI